MKKRLKALLLSALMLASLGVTCVTTASAATSDAYVQDVMQALGVMEGDQNGNISWYSTVTRAEFAKMILKVSPQKDNVPSDGTGYSLYSDVKTTHWASAYIKVAVENGYMTGYTDGTFRPSTNITWVQAVNAALTLLGYDPTSLVGSYPDAQMNLATQLGLLDGISATGTGTMTRMECAQFLYNLLETSTDSGYYGTTIGCPITNGEVDYSALMEENLSGPYIWSATSSLSFTPTEVYVGSSLSTVDALQTGDVYYYNLQTKTVWIHRESVTGTVSAITPSSLSPTAVTVNGVSYNLSTSAAVSAISYIGGVEVGDSITLLLGLDGGVADVSDSLDGIYYGVVESYSYTTSSTSNTIQTVVVVNCTDGGTYSFTVSGESTYTIGSVVTAQTTTSGTTVKKYSTTKSYSGTVNSKGTSFGSYSFADDVEIIDVDDSGAVAIISTTRLAGVTLSSSDIDCVVFNTSGEVSKMILDNATGDAGYYGYMTSASSSSSSSSSSLSVSGEYTYILDGTTRNLNGSASYSISTGGIAVFYDADGSFSTFKQLSSVTLKQLSNTTALSTSSKEYGVASGVDVYIYIDGSYQLSTVDTVSDTDNYSLTGWYETYTGSAGGYLRVIIATPK